MSSFLCTLFQNFYRYYAFRAVESHQKNNVSNEEITCTGHDAAATAEGLKSSDPTVKLVVPSDPNEKTDREVRCTVLKNINLHRVESNVSTILYMLALVHLDVFCWL